MVWITVACVVAIAIGLFFGIRQKQKNDEKERRKLYKVDMTRPTPTFPVATQGGPKPRPVNAPIVPSGDPLTVDGDFVVAGSPEDKVGDPVLARKVSISRSDFWILPEAYLFKPGDQARFRARIVDENSGPLADVPVYFMNRAQRRQLGGHKRTDAAGVAEVLYTVTDQDQIGDPSTPDPDTGSYIVDCYAGGRKLIRIRPLHDVA